MFLIYKITLLRYVIANSEKLLRTKTAFASLDGCGLKKGMPMQDIPFCFAGMWYQRATFSALPLSWSIM